MKPPLALAAKSAKLFEQRIFHKPVRGEIDDVFSRVQKITDQKRAGTAFPNVHMFRNAVKNGSCMLRYLQPSSRQP